MNPDQAPALRRLVLTDEGTALVEFGVPEEWVRAYGIPYVREATLADFLDAMNQAAARAGEAISGVGKALAETFTPFAETLTAIDGQSYPLDRPRHVSKYGPPPRGRRGHH